MTKDELKNLIDESKSCAVVIDNCTHGGLFESFDEAIDSANEIKRQADKMIEIITKFKEEFGTIEIRGRAISALLEGIDNALNGLK